MADGGKLDAQRPATPRANNALRFAISRNQEMIAYLVAVVALLVAVITPFVLLSILREPDRVIVIDGSGTIHVGPLEQLTGDSKYFEQATILATKALLERTSVGLDMPEMMRSLFSADAIRKANKDVEWQLTDLKARNLRQQVSVSAWQAIREVKGQRVFVVRGTLSRAGNLNGTPIAESEPFTVLLVFIKNPRLDDRNRYPYIVADFRIDQPPRPAGVG